MKTRIKSHSFALLVCLLVLPLSACSQSNVGTIMEEYLWQNRVVLVFAPSNDASLTAQQRILSENASGLAERNIVTWQFIAGESVMVDEQRLAHLGTEPFYTHFAIDHASFTFLLIGKDGEEKLRVNEVVTAEKLFAMIDAMPMRQREIESQTAQ